jgi:hypothetical protein
MTDGCPSGRYPWMLRHLERCDLFADVLDVGRAPVSTARSLLPTSNLCLPSVALVRSGRLARG